MIFAVIDTNVIVAAMMSKHSDSATVKVINAVANSGDSRANDCYHRRAFLAVIVLRRYEGSVQIPVAGGGECVDAASGAGWHCACQPP